MVSMVIAIVRVLKTVLKGTTLESPDKVRGPRLPQQGPLRTSVGPIRVEAGLCWGLIGVPSYALTAMAPSWALIVLNGPYWEPNFKWPRPVWGRTM